MPPSQRPRVPPFITVLEGVIFFGILLVMVLTAIPYGTVHPWSEAIFECSIFLLALLCVIDFLFTGTVPLKNLKVFYPIAALIALALVQSLLLWDTNAGGTKVWYSLSADPFETRLFALRTGAMMLSGIML